MEEILASGSRDGKGDILATFHFAFTTFLENKCCADQTVPLWRSNAYKVAKKQKGVTPFLFTPSYERWEKSVGGVEFLRKWMWRTAKRQNNKGNLKQHYLLSNCEGRTLALCTARGKEWICLRKSTKCFFYFGKKHGTFIKKSHHPPPPPAVLPCVGPISRPNKDHPQGTSSFDISIWF